MAAQIPFFKKLARKVSAPIKKIEKWSVVRGDLVELLAGKDAGRQGKVIRVDRDKNRVFVEGLNLQAHRIKGRGQEKGKVSLKPGPVHYSNVSLVDPSTGDRTRTATRYLEDGSSVRISKKTGTIIPKPEELKERKKPRDFALGEKDTPVNLAWKRTYIES